MSTLDVIQSSDKSISSHGAWGWILGIILTSFYIVLYFFPQYLGLGKDGAENITKFPFGPEHNIIKA